MDKIISKVLILKLSDGIKTALSFCCVDCKILSLGGEIVGNTGPAFQPGKLWLKEMGVIARDKVDNTFA